MRSAPAAAGSTHGRTRLDPTLRRQRDETSLDVVVLARPEGNGHPGSAIRIEVEGRRE
jgi:hypothetical protein